jgi:CheY-like chemotaxis protein
MSQSEKLHVLLVEDSALTAEQLREMILGHRREVSCTVVATESDALEKIDSSHIHAAVLDLRLKEGTGFSVLRKLASLEPRPFIVVITNFALPSYRDLALLAGADYFLDKATTIYVLPDLLNQHFERISSSRTH